PSPVMTYFSTGEPFAAALLHVTVACLSPATALTCVGAPGGPTRGFAGGGGGGGLAGGGPPPLPVAGFLAPVSRPPGCAGRALDAMGVLTYRWAPRTSSCTWPPPCGTEMVSSSVPVCDST